MRRAATTSVLSALLAVLAFGGAIGLVLDAERGPTPPVARAAEPREADDGVIDFAGSGSNLPLTEVLLDAYASRHPDVRVRLHEGIGSTGAIRAIRDGAIDVGLVSRPIEADDREGLTVIPYARVEVVLGGHPAVRTDRIARRDLLDLYAGRTRADLPRLVIQRERGDSSHRAVDRVFLEFAAVNEEAWQGRLHRVVYSDESMIQALLETPGAAGLVDRGRLVLRRVPLRVIEVEGLEAEKELSFVVRSVDPRVGAFVDFCLGDEGRAIIAGSGYHAAREAP
jgi:phosphate transport system substrate-binding protein